jgi:lipopolysaccharide transport protein LptA
MSKNSVNYVAAFLSLGLSVGCISPQLGKTGAAAAEVHPGPSPSPGPMTTQVVMQYPQTRPVDEKRPVRITSDHLHYNDKLKESEFIGHVVATQDTETMYADRMRSSTQGESAWANGHLRMVDFNRKVELLADEGDYSGALSEANLRGGVILHSVDPYSIAVTVTGETGWFQSVSRLARLSGGVHVERGRLTATAESAYMDGGLDRLNLLGNVKANFGVNCIQAQSATLDDLTKSILFEGDVDASLIPTQVRDSASHPERP